MLRTRAPVVSGIATLLPLDLHVLGLPLALILSQDQTLHSKVDLGSAVIMLSVIRYQWILPITYNLITINYLH